MGTRIQTNLMGEVRTLVRCGKWEAPGLNGRLNI